jgi:glutaredoxin
MADTLQLYWQPGCTSCLRTREFLAAHAIAFDSFNVLENNGALQRLQSRGLRSVPVLLRGDQHVFAQDLDEVAAFVGVALQRERLGTAEFLLRLEQLLQVATELTLAVPAERQFERLPGRERSWLDLTYHIPMIVTAFLDAAEGGALTYDYYERTPAPADQSIGRIAAIAQAAGTRLSAWRRANPAGAVLDARMLTTYFGSRELPVVLERTTWHVAQHCRQLESLVAGVERGALIPRLTPAMLAGLPLPQNVWDPEPV